MVNPVTWDRFISEWFGFLVAKIITLLLYPLIDWLRAGRSGDRIPVGAKFSAPVPTGPGAHPSSCTMGTGYFPGVKSGRDVTLTPQPLLVPWSRKSRAIPLLPLWAVQPGQSLSACTYKGALTLLYAYFYFQKDNRAQLVNLQTKPCETLEIQVLPFLFYS